MIITIAIGVVLGILAAVGMFYAGLRWGRQGLRVAILLVLRAWKYKLRIASYAAAVSMAAIVVVGWMIHQDHQQRSRESNFTQRLFFPDAPDWCWPQDGSGPRGPEERYRWLKECHAGYSPTRVPRPVRQGDLIGFIGTPPAPTKSNYRHLWKKWQRGERVRLPNQ